MSEYFRFLDNDEEDSESGRWVTIEDGSSDEIIIEYKHFDCPTDEIIVKSTSCGVSRRRSGGGVVRTPSPSPPAQVPSVTQPQEEVIVIPASADTLQQAIQQVTANGVTVLDVRSLGGSSGRSSPSSSEPQVTVVQAAEGHHYIAVTGNAPQSYASLSNALAEGDGGGVGYHVQYVEPQELYTQSHQGQGQVSYSLYSGVNEGSNNFSPGGSSTTGQWYGSQPGSHHYLISGTPTGQETVNTIHRTSPQTVSAEVSYLNASHGSGQDESAGVQAGHAARTSPATVSQFTVQWLLENYETAEGVSLPRSTLYNHYLRHCSQRELEPVNAASFGKLIRSVFMGLRTRRLGTRGNSKYHYYGIRVKPGSSLSSMGFDGGAGKAGSGRCSSGSRGASGGTGAAGGGSQVRQDEQATNSHMHQHQQYLGDGSGAIPNFPEIHFTRPLPGDCTHEDVDTLRSIYREHCEAFLDAVLSLELTTVESLWREFWRQNNNNDTDECEEEKYLSKTKLYHLCSMSEVQSWVRNVDVNFYQRLVQVLLPDVLRPIPSPLTQAIRNFAKGLESWLVGAMSGCPSGMIRAKSGPAAALAQSLRRYTSLNHLAQAARAVLHNSHQIQQMLADLNRVDFHNVQEQASWVCQCPSEVVSELEADFKRTLQKQASLEQWASWLEAAVKKALRPHEGFQDYAHHARQFLLKWSFYSSMVIRDLTLRSAASFGSFHLIRLLYDEYMFYLIEHHVAEHQGSAPIQVMAEREAEGMNGNVEEEEEEPEDDNFVVSSVCIKTEEVPSKKMKIS